MPRHGAVYLRLAGGLGNQLYQFSFANLLCEKLNIPDLVVSISGMRKYPEVWGLLLFNVIDVQKLRPRVVLRPYIGSELRLPKIMPRNPFARLGLHLVSDANSSVLPVRIPAAASDPGRKSFIYLDGYFEKTPLRIEAGEIMRRRLDDGLLSLNPSESLVINIRGGELKKLGRTGLNDREFFLNHVSSALLSNPRLTPRVITDDPEFASDLLRPVLTSPSIADPDPIGNFHEIYASPFKILSRSTFSKWAGFLSEGRSICIYQDPF